MTESTSKGKFITFEGIDGCGKTTQAEKLLELLEKKELSVSFIREPGGDPISESIRKLLLHAEESMSDRAEALLMVASRAQLTDKVILPHLLNGRWVIGDRYADSTLAYQGGGRGLSAAALENMNNFGTYTLKPDLTFFIDISVEEANERMSVSRDRIEREGTEFQQRVRDFYLNLQQKEPERVILIDGHKSIDDIHEQVCSVVNERLL